MIYVIVTNDVKDGCMEPFLAACRDLRPLVLAEDGCLGYEHVVGVSWPPGSGNPVDENRVVVVETWEDDAALGKHLQQPHGKAFAQEVRELRHGVKIEAFRSVFG